MELDETHNILQLCRICLCTNESKFINLFNEKVSPDSIFFADVIYLCTSIKLTVEDNLPSAICRQCAIKSKNLLEFKQLCENSEYTLRKLLVQTKVNINGNILETKKENRLKITKENSDWNTNNYKEELQYNLQSNKCTEDKVVIKKEENQSDIVVETHKNSIDSVSISNNYTCNICGNQYESHSLIKNHCEEKVHVCALCKKSFTYKHSLKAHIDRIHGIVATYECEDCGKVFNARSNLVRHKLIHSGEKPHRCGECSAAFIQNVQLQDHIRRHHTFEKPYSCTKCEKRYVAAYDLKRHLQFHVKNTADIIRGNKAICGICNEEFPSETKLKLHKASHISSYHLCSECGKRFTTKRGLQCHQELHKDKIIKCNTCQKTFATNRQLMLHSKSHGPKKYLCNTCGNKYATKHGLNLHMAVHSNDRPFICSIEDCNKTFRFKNSLKFHMLSHTGEKKYSCNECGKNFAQSGHLFYHKRFHSGLRPYKCTMCNKTFAVKSNFNSHMRRHTGNKKFICIVCNQRFYDSSSLSKHKKKIHVEIA